MLNCETIEMFLFGLLSVNPALLKIGGSETQAGFLILFVLTRTSKLYGLQFSTPTFFTYIFFYFFSTMSAYNVTSPKSWDTDAIGPPKFQPFVLCPLSFVLCPLSSFLSVYSFFLCILSFFRCPLSFDL